MEKVNEEEWNHKKPTWWQRNWKWLVPSLGCLGILIIGFIVLGGLIFKGINILSNSVPEKQIIVKLESNPQVVEAIGIPITKGSNQIVSVDYNNGKQITSGEFLVHGPKGSGSVVFEGFTSHKVWTFTLLTFDTKQGEKINLLE